MIDFFITENYVTNMDCPKKIIRYRERKFTIKRNNYKNYKAAKWDWIDIFNIIESGEKISIVAEIYAINYKTLYSKYFNWKKNKSDIYEIDRRGKHNKRLSEDEERDLVSYITDVYKNKINK